MGENTIKRIGYIDIAKCVAIICVVVGHVLAYDLYGFDTVWDKSELMRFLCSFHMPLFMFLSGLVSLITIEKTALLKDFLKRVRTLLVPFIVFASVYSLWSYGNLDFVFSEMKFGYWYLWVLFIFYIITYPIVSGGVKFKSYILAFLAWFVANHYVEKVPIEISDVVSLKLMTAYYPYYLIGNFIKRFKLHELAFGNCYIFYIAASIWLCASFLSFNYSQYVITTAAILVIMNICKKMDVSGSKINRHLVFLGQNTLYIYVFHYFALQLMKTTFFRDFLCLYSNITIDLLLVIIPTVFAIAFSLGMKFVLKREPLVMKYVLGKD